MPKHQWNVVVDRDASGPNHAVLTAKDGSYGLTILAGADGELDTRVDYGTPTAMEQIEAMEFAQVHGWV